jgi:hypothetical protein
MHHDTDDAFYAIVDILSKPTSVRRLKARDTRRQIRERLASGGYWLKVFPIGREGLRTHGRDCRHSTFDGILELYTCPGADPLPGIAVALWKRTVFCADAMRGSIQEYRRQVGRPDIAPPEFLVERGIVFDVLERPAWRQTISTAFYRWLARS